MGTDAALKSQMGASELLRVIPKQALADEPEKSGYKTKQGCASTTRRKKKSCMNMTNIPNDVGKLEVTFLFEHRVKARVHWLRRRSKALGVSSLCLNIA